MVRPRQLREQSVDGSSGGCVCVYGGDLREFDGEGVSVFLRREFRCVELSFELGEDFVEVVIAFVHFKGVAMFL